MTKKSDSRGINFHTLIRKWYKASSSSTVAAAAAAWSSPWNKATTKKHFATIQSIFLLASGVCVFFSLSLFLQATYTATKPDVLCFSVANDTHTHGQTDRQTDILPLLPTSSLSLQLQPQIINRISPLIIRGRLANIYAKLFFFSFIISLGE